MFSLVYRILIKCLVRRSTNNICINGVNGNKMMKYTKSCRNKVEIDIQGHLTLTQMLIVHNEKSKKSKNDQNKTLSQQSTHEVS